MPYYRHPSSAACFPAPSGCRLRPFVGNRGLRGLPRISWIFKCRFGASPPFFWSPYTVLTKKKDLSGAEIWAPKVESDLSGGEMQRIPIQIRHLFALSKSHTKWGTPLVLVHHYLSNFRIYSKNPRNPHF